MAIVNPRSLEEIPQHRLFNWLQNLNCTLVVDFRDIEHYDASHIFSSLHYLNSNLFKRFKNIIRVVAITTTKFKMTKDDILSFLLNLQMNESESFQPSLCLLNCNYEDFELTYSNCQSLFNHSYSSKNQTPKRMCYPNEIIPKKIFLGNSRQSGDENVLTDLKITHIVDATGMETSRNSAEKLNLNYLPINIDDVPSTNISEYFQQVNNFIDSAFNHHHHDDDDDDNLNQEMKVNESHECKAIETKNAKGGDEQFRVLIHCQAGVSRGCSLTLSYLLHSQYVNTLKEAYHIVLSERHWVCPNQSFRLQLRDYEQSVLIQNSSSASFNKNNNNNFFKNDKENLDFIMSYFNRNNLSSHIATIYDDTPITAGRNNHLSFEEKLQNEIIRDNLNKNNVSSQTSSSSFDNSSIDVTSEETMTKQQVGEAEETTKKKNGVVKKPFLRRGQGKHASALSK